MIKVDIVNRVAEASEVSRVKAALAVDTIFNAKSSNTQIYQSGNLIDSLTADGVPIGRLYVWRGDDEIVIVDVTILPEHQTGIGAALVRELLREGDRLGKPVRAHVEKINRAWKLWVRVGFRIVGDTGLYYELEKLPGEGPATTRQSARRQAKAPHDSHQPVHQ